MTAWTVAHQVPLSLGFSRQERSGLPFPTSGDVSDPGIEPASLMFPALAGGFFTTSSTWEHSIVLKGKGGWALGPRRSWQKGVVVVQPLIHTVEYYSALKTKEIPSRAALWGHCAKWNKPVSEKTNIVWDHSYEGHRRVIFVDRNQNGNCQGLPCQKGEMRSCLMIKSSCLARW